MALRPRLSVGFAFSARRFRHGGPWGTRTRGPASTPPPKPAGSSNDSIDPAGGPLVSIRRIVPTGEMARRLLDESSGGPAVTTATLTVRRTSRVTTIETTEVTELRYVRDSDSGIRRVKGGAGFRYVGPGGRAVRGRETLARIRSLAIPPAWADVWICPETAGHIQATGRDARGRKQYRYHARWRRGPRRDEVRPARRVRPGAAPAPRRGSTPTSAGPGCRARRCWRRWSTCSTAPTCGSATPSTSGPTSRSA